MRHMAIAILILLVSSMSALGHGEETFAAAESLIEAKVACENLTNDQLEIIGDYYMEQIHPGEEHEYMDEMMGGEGSESLRQMHINIARSFYCGEHELYEGFGMRNNYGMMGPGMMGAFGIGGNQMAYGMMGYGSTTMMGGIGYTLYSLLYVALAAFIFGMVFWWTYKIMIGDKKHK